MNKRGLFAAFLLYAIAMQSSAQSGGYYEPIPYYNNNPFLFCTLGVPSDCWAPINPATGTFTVTNPYCYNAYSALMYARICPKAFPNGVQQGATGTQPSSFRSPTALPAN
ncbi:hypothetical protein FZ025_21020 [Xanthomonas hyacinthi]|uniref:hypothetical protein n=1 Tax=Xanthomonas hyacinthi TaxID=56455 RepID=UPI000A4B3D46|nr:hypothetical protein [Xanthomonas hyacinthi]QGY78972.1 hypothetical protein FZ025_21020 [Xanthomonas hyacinthi]